MTIQWQGVKNKSRILSVIIFQKHFLRVFFPNINLTYLSKECSFSPLAQLRWVQPWGWKRKSGRQSRKEGIGRSCMTSVEVKWFSGSSQPCSPGSITCPLQTSSSNFTLLRHLQGLVSGRSQHSYTMVWKDETDHNSSIALVP